jgi:outer membrane protein TolC
LSNSAYPHSKIAPKVILLSLICSALSACGFQEYIAKPIDPAAFSQKLADKRTDNNEFHQYLINNGYPSQSLPIQQWQLDDLIHCALFFNPNLDTARAQWRSAQAAQQTAAERRLPSISGQYSDSNNANDEISPYAYSFSIAIPVETANKRNIRIESAQHLTEVAKLNIAQTAWRLRNDVANTFNEYQVNRELINLMLKEQDYRQHIVAMYQKRIEFGESANIELIKSKLQLQTLNTELESRQRNQSVLLARLANNLGLSLAQVEQMQIKESLNTKLLSNPVATDIQTRALLNRLDIRMALERYAVAEAKVKLEIAKQYPDITISPGYTYEFGNKMWNLGLSSLMTFLTKNKLAIAEATQLREVEAKQFEALQSNVISEVNVASAKLAQAMQMLENKKILYQQQQANTSRIDDRLRAGESDRLELTYTRLEEVIAEQHLALAHFQLAASTSELENAIQAPLTDSNITNEKIENLTTTK